MKLNSCQLKFVSLDTYFQNLSTFRIPPQNIFKELDQWWCSLSKPPCKIRLDKCDCRENPIISEFGGFNLTSPF